MPPRNYDGAAGRWPPNVLFSHHDTCGDRCTDQCPLATLDAQAHPAPRRCSPTPEPGDDAEPVVASRPRSPVPARGPSRFFPAFRWQPKAAPAERPRINHIRHPTVKPLDLVRWLARLITPPGGTIIDPFLGSGTTALAARLDGFSCIGIESDPVYFPLIAHRLGTPVRRAA